jgi:hypothetical protein
VATSSIVVDFMLFSASQEKDGVVVNVNKSTGKDTL